MQDSQHDAALTAALRAIELAPQSPRVALAVVEQLCSHPRAQDAIARAYELVADAAVGPVGQRTAEQRAARWRTWFKVTDVPLGPGSQPPMARATESTPTKRLSRRPPCEDDDLSLRSLVWGDSVPPPAVAPKLQAQDDLRSLAWGSRPPGDSDASPASEPAPSSLSSRPESDPPAALGRIDLQPSPRPRRRSRSHIPPPASEPPPHVSWAPQATSAAEEALIIELSAGSFKAGDRLVALYEKDARPRLRDAVGVRRLQAMLQRGDRAVIVCLRDAARDNGESAYVQAIEHVLGVLDDEPRTPPALSSLRPLPAMTAAVLMGDLDETVNEALGIVWQSGLLRRDVSDYELSGTDRVPIGAQTAAGHIFSELGRVLDLGGMRLFHRSRTSGPLQSSVALLNPLALVLSGSAKRDSRPLRFRIGQAVAAATPRLALVAGLDEDELRDLLAALRTSFGPVGNASVTSITAARMRLAQDLWQVVGADGERRLRELCEDTDSISPSHARDNMLRVARRMGLFAAGDLYISLVETLGSLDLRGGINALRAGDPELWNHPAVADLFDIAIAPQFAASRWQTSV
jgi:hypothetical protein